MILLPDEGGLLHGICDDFEHIFFPSTFPESELEEGRSSEGMALFFLSSLNFNINNMYEECNF